MANKVYDIWMQELLQGTAGTALTGTLKVALIDAADYTFDQTHDFLADVAGAAIVGTAQTLANKTYTNGVLNADDVTFTTVAGDPCEALLLYLDTGASATSRLVAYIDTGVTGLPVTPNGGNITITWNASGIIDFCST